MTEVGAYSILFAVIGLVLIGISIPLIMRKVPAKLLLRLPHQQNSFRSKNLVRDKLFSGIDFCIAGFVVLVISPAMSMLGQTLETNHAVVALLIILLLSVGGAAWQGWILIKRI